MNTYIPFTYLLRFKPTGQLYYGSKSAKGCDPSVLWSSYFTSSKTIKSLIAEHGTNAFDFEIRRTFNTASEARKWESRFLRRVKAVRSDLWLNKHDGANFGISGPMSASHKENHSKSMKSRRNPSPWTEERKIKYSAIKTGIKIHTDESKAKIGAANAIALKGRTVAEDVKAKISASTTGVKKAPFSEEHKANIGAVHKGITKKRAACDLCGRDFSVQNLSRHTAICIIKYQQDN